MDKVIQLEKHHIEAWGIWWIQWQQDTRNAMKSVSSEAKNSLGNTTTSLVLPPK
jgi:hypothetical protein